MGYNLYQEGGLPVLAAVAPKWFQVVIGMPFTIAGGRLFLYCKNEQQKQNHKADFGEQPAALLMVLVYHTGVPYVNSLFAGVLEKVWQMWLVGGAIRFRWRVGGLPIYFQMLSLAGWGV